MKLNQESKNKTDTKKYINLYFCNQMSSNHLERESQLKNIIKKNIKSKLTNSTIKLNTYYKNKKLKTLCFLEKYKRPEPWTATM